MQTQTNNQQTSRDNVKKRLIDLGITQRYLAKIHRRSPQQITQALNGEQPGLLKRVIAHIEKLEAQKNIISKN